MTSNKRHFINWGQRLINTKITFTGNTVLLQRQRRILSYENLVHLHSCASQRGWASPQVFLAFIHDQVQYDTKRSFSDQID